MVGDDIRCAERLFKECERIIRRTGINAEDLVCGSGLIRKGCQSSGEIGTAVVGDHNGSDVNILVN